MRNKKVNIIFKKTLLFFLFISITLGLGYLYFKTGFFTIKNYEISGVKDEHKEILLKKLGELSNNKLYKILPGNRTISFHTNDIRKFVLEILPNTASMSIYPISPHILKISITGYEPLFRVAENKAMTIDGIIYTEIEDINNLPIIKIATSSEVSRELLYNISLLISKVSVAIFGINSIEIDDYKDIYLRGGKNDINTIIFNSSSNVDKVWSNLVSAIDTEPLKSKLEKEKNKLLYLDARFGNKVFYKFTNGQSASIIENYATTTQP